MLRNWFSDPKDTDPSFIKMTRNILIFAIVEAAARCAVLSLKNAYLLQEAQKMAAKERTIGEISAKISGSSNLESILPIAIQELGNTLPETNIAIQFKRSQETE